MPKIFSIQFIDELFKTADYASLVSICNQIPGWPGYDSQKANYGLPLPIFAVLETLAWVAQSDRSGAWTYYESVRPETQTELLRALIDLAPKDFADAYRLGMETWKDPRAISAVDKWVRDNDQLIERWQWSVLRTNRALVEELL